MGTWGTAIKSNDTFADIYYTFNQLYNDGEQQWYVHGKLHRDNDQPAIIYANGRREWYQQGQLHRDNGPAVITPNNIAVWYEYGRLVDPLINL